MTEKHAFLIIAHQEDQTLRRLIDLLDDDRNDIFIHYDLKSGKPNSNFYKTKHSNIYLYNEIDVQWGAFSLVEVELLLLKKSTEIMAYRYYHLISGSDFLIKTNDYLHNFFDENSGKEFIRFESDTFNYPDRVHLNHFLQEKVGRAKPSFLYYLNKIQLRLQKLIGYSRNKDIDFQKGTQWFSITDHLARYVLSKEDWIYKVFKNTLCSDEIYLQTIVHNSSFRNNLYHPFYDNSTSSIMRLIDWERGTPYVFSDDDFDEIINSEMIFCRKINSLKSEKMYNYLIDS